MGHMPELIKRKHTPHGFTIVELLIAIAVIAILASLTAVSYSGVQQRARNAQLRSNLHTVSQLIEAYKVDNASYPNTTNNPKANWRASDVLTDDNCSNGSSQPDWIPGVDQLPQSNVGLKVGVDGVKGCYLYVSNGKDYILSAWNMVSEAQSSFLYRRVGFRQFQTDSSTQFYTCNDNNVGGVQGGSYDITKDYYKHSYTISNISDCNETPPAGA